MTPERSLKEMAAFVKLGTGTKTVRVDLAPAVHKSLSRVAVDQDKSIAALTRGYLANIVQARPFQAFTLILADGSRVDVEDPLFVGYAGGRMAGVMNEDERVRLIDVALVVAIVRRGHFGRHLESFLESFADPGWGSGSGIEQLEASAMGDESERRSTPYVDLVLFECLRARAKSAEARRQLTETISRWDEAMRRLAETVAELKGLPRFGVTRGGDGDVSKTRP
jgi:hypothetical protein